MKLQHIGLSLFFALSLTGCGSRVHTNMEGAIDPSYRWNSRIQRMIVKGEDLSLMEEGAVIRSLRKAARNYDLDLVNGLDIFPPTKAYSSSAMRNTAQRHSVGFILYVTAKKYESSRYIPVTRIRSEKSYDSFSKKDITETTVESGHYEEDRQINVELKIIDTRSGHTVFVANGNSFGTNVNFSELIDALSNKTLSYLAEKHLIVRRTGH